METRDADLSGAMYGEQRGHKVEYFGRQAPDFAQVGETWTDPAGTVRVLTDSGWREVP